MLKKLVNFLQSPAEAPLVFSDSTVLPYWVLRMLVQTGEQSRGVIICQRLSDAERLAGELEEVGRTAGIIPPVALLPEIRTTGRSISAVSEAERLKALDGFLQGKFRWLIAGCEAMLAPTLPPAELMEKEIILEAGRDYPFENLIKQLIEFDYDDEYEVHTPGEFSRRGGIIDIFSPSAELPVRLEFWGDQLETIREFDPATQRTVRHTDKARIIPRNMTDSREESADCFDYLDRIPEAQMWEIASDEIIRHLERFSGREGVEKFAGYRSKYSASGRYLPFYAPGTPGIAVTQPAISAAFPSIADMVGAAAGEGVFRALARELLRLQKADWQIAMVTPDPEGDFSHIRTWCCDYGIDFGKVEIVPGLLPSGVLLNEVKCAFLTEREFLGVVKKRHVFSNAEKREQEQDNDTSAVRQGEASFLADLDEGDLAVHVNYGIGIFRGVRLIESNGLKREMMVMEFAGGAKIMFPLRHAHLIHRYIGSAGKVALSKPAGNKWNKDKETARKSVKEYAADLLRLQAVRQSVKALDMPVNRLEEETFAGHFEYQETIDQLRSINEIYADMEGDRPMDRLLCGDVGYGKTEVAMRAAFRVASAGYQVLLVAPTTVLAQQHFFTFRERFAATGLIVEMLSRFQNNSQQRDILTRAASGGVDILIGTHRLFSTDIKLPNPGLVIIDEEQRFGVKHKEKLRQFRSEINVLTLSATPIPRTLYMALAGARDLSTIFSAPSRRLPVETVVTEGGEKVIAHAIEQELARGGQVFYLHNRVQTIMGVKARLEARFPDVRFGVAHGQLEEEELENVMSDFLDGKIDVLVCTTIIESGLDVPNANTIIIERADRFGLAELYQLRGRVGRWKRQAYAYLIVPKGELMTDDGHKRIAAIRRYTHLGAGFKLALRDLEIRGSGNLLGHEQSGHLKAVGFELYCQLLKNEVSRLQGGKVEFLPEVEIEIDFVGMAHEVPEGLLPCGIPPEYIPSARLRVGAYRRMASMVSVEEIPLFEEEMRDRFGKLPAPLENMLAMVRLRITAARRGITRITAVNDTCAVFGSDGRIMKYADGTQPRLHPKNPLPAKLREIIENIIALP